MKRRISIFFSGLLDSYHSAICVSLIFYFYVFVLINFVGTQTVEITPHHLSTSMAVVDEATAYSGDAYWMSPAEPKKRLVLTASAGNDRYLTILPIITLHF